MATSNDADIIIGTDVDTSGVEKGMEEVKEIVEDEDIEINPDIDTKDVEQKSNNLGKGITKSLTKSLGSVGKIISVIIDALSGAALVVLFAIVGVLALIIGSFSKLNEENEEVHKQWEEIKNTMSNALSQIGSAIANVFLPVIQKILDGLKTMLQYIGYILKAWFGIDIFTKSTSKNLKNGVNSAKEMNKQLAGWDEMTVLQDNKSSGANGSSGALLEPLEEGDVPRWLKWIADNGDKVKKIILAIATAIGTALLVLNLTNPVGWVLLVIGALGLLLSYWEEIKTFFSKVASWVKEKIIDPVVDLFVGLYETLKKIFTPIVEFFTSIFSTIFNNFVTYIDNIRKLYQFLWSKIKEIFEPVVNFFKEKFQQAVEKIKEVFSPLISFFSALWDTIKSKLKAFGIAIGNVIGSAFKTAFNGIMATMETVLNTPIKAINKLLNVINKVPGIDLDTLSTFKLPRLAKGTILNNPGKGVPVAGGSAIAGEAGREAYLPLSDTQLLEELGSTIGKYITINANIVNSMNGRIISRELKKISSEDDFAFNR